MPCWLCGQSSLGQAVGSESDEAVEDLPALCSSRTAPQERADPGHEAIQSVPVSRRTQADPVSIPRQLEAACEEGIVWFLAGVATDRLPLPGPVYRNGIDCFGASGALGVVTGALGE
jgi:hypothetical protein